MDPKVVGGSLLLLGIILLAGKALRVRVKWIQKLFLPSSIIGGSIALILGPGVFGQIAKRAGYDGFSEAGVFTPEILEVWRTLPGLLISVVFATLFLGQKLPGPRKVVKLAGPQLSLGVALASGQYVVGMLLALLVLVPVFGLPAISGTLIEIGFEGGHGTAGGMIPVFEEVGWADGGDLAIGTATVGLIGGIVIGMALINWAVRTGRTKVISSAASRSWEEQAGLFRRDEQYVGAYMTTRPASIEPLSLHVGFVAVAVLLGQLMLWGLQWIEGTFWPETKLLAYVPLFPLAMIGGIFFQMFMKAIKADHLIDEQMMMRIQGLALDVLITSAMATLSIRAISANFWPFVILCLGGILINVLILLVYTPRGVPDYWFERGIGDFGQAMGVTATGLILMRIVDPDGRSPALPAFGYKQLVFEPFFGGGLITALSVPMIIRLGPWPWFIVMLVVFVAAILSGLLYWGRTAPSPEAAALHGTDFPPHDE